MLKYAAFSALRLAKLFPPAHLESYPFYIEVDPDGDFDTEYQGGQWHEETIDGVQLWYPAAAGDQLGGVDVWACAYLPSGPVRDKPDPKARGFVDAWRANADRVLEALELPVRMG